MLGQRLRQSCMCLIFNWTPERKGVGVPNTLRYVLTSFKLVSLRVYGQIANITLVNRIVESQHIIITFHVYSNCDKNVHFAICQNVYVDLTSQIVIYSPCGGGTEQ